jgi:hypothetical protein
MAEALGFEPPLLVERGGDDLLPLEEPEGDAPPETPGGSVH